MCIRDRCHIDQQIILGQDNFLAAEIKFQSAFCFQRIHSFVSVDLCQGLPDIAKLLSVFWSNGLKLRFEEMCIRDRFWFSARSIISSMLDFAVTGR